MLQVSAISVLGNQGAFVMPFTQLALKNWEYGHLGLKQEENDEKTIESHQPAAIC